MANKRISELDPVIAMLDTMELEFAIPGVNSLRGNNLQFKNYLEPIISHDNLLDVNIAGAGVSLGHLSDQPQTIEGDKTINGIVKADGTTPPMAGMDPGAVFTSNSTLLNVFNQTAYTPNDRVGMQFNKGGKQITMQAGGGVLIDSHGTGQFQGKIAMHARDRITLSGDVNGVQVGLFGTDGAQPDSLFSINSTTKGFLPPRMTTIQRGNIPSPSFGLVIYNTTTNKLNLYNGTTWEEVGGGGGSPVIPSEVDHLLSFSDTVGGLQNTSLIYEAAVGGGKAITSSENLLYLYNQDSLSNDDAVGITMDRSARQMEISAADTLFLLSLGTDPGNGEINIQASKTILMNASDGVHVGSSLVHSSVEFSINSTTKGFVLPSMTTTQRDAISPVWNGLMVYDNNYQNISYRKGIVWRDLAVTQKDVVSQSTTSNVEDWFTDKEIINAGGSDITLTLPAISTATIGARYSFTVEVNQVLSISVDGTDTIRNVNHSGLIISSDEIGNTVTLKCLADDTEWVVDSIMGQWDLS